MTEFRAPPVRPLRFFWPKKSINQMVASERLKRRDTVTVVENGRQCVAAVERDDFDGANGCSHAEMDGFAAARYPRGRRPIDTCP
jgi:hypothetical protein